ncbi:hypothetical protein [Acinetobacter sp. P1(2025)]|uniref:hypothetical protein n=1 Tax=Acinetobacter sp. P1(2025) TaxID=3446120 RepID=UPI003F53B0C9
MNKLILSAVFFASLSTMAFAGDKKPKDCDKKPKVEKNISTDVKKEKPTAPQQQALIYERKQPKTLNCTTKENDAVSQAKSILNL